MTTIFIVRHGETEWNVKNLLQGHKDSSLTEKGVAQASQVAGELKDIHFDKIFSSDLLRTKRTAEIIALEKKLAVETTKALREQHYGQYEGMDRTEFFKLFDRWEEMTHEERHTYKLSDDMESNEEAVSRFIIFLREVSVAYPEKTILMVAHGGIMRYLLIHLGYWTYATREGLGNAASIKIESDGVDFFLKEVKGVKKLET